MPQFVVPCCLAFVIIVGEICAAAYAAYAQEPPAAATKTIGSEVEIVLEQADVIPQRFGAEARVVAKIHAKSPVNVYNPNFSTALPKVARLSAYDEKGVRVAREGASLAGSLQTPNAHDWLFLPSGAFVGSRITCLLKHDLPTTTLDRRLKLQLDVPKRLTLPPRDLGAAGEEWEQSLRDWIQNRDLDQPCFTSNMLDATAADAPVNEHSPTDRPPADSHDVQMVLSKPELTLKEGCLEIRCEIRFVCRRSTTMFNPFFFNRAVAAVTLEIRDGKDRESVNLVRSTEEKPMEPVITDWVSLRNGDFAGANVVARSTLSSRKSKRWAPGDRISLRLQATERLTSPSGMHFHRTGRWEEYLSIWKTNNALDRANLFSNVLDTVVPE